MTASWIAITLLWTFIFIYSIGGSIDFGAGFWAMLYGIKKDVRAAALANRYLSPSWEVTNVFLVLIVVALVTFFPKALFTLGTVLLVPGSLILILLTLRSAFMVYSHVVKKYDAVLRIISGVTGLLIPGLLISVLPIIQGGFIETDPNGIQRLLLGKLFTSPREYAYLGFGVSSTLFLSTILLADYARVAGDESSYRLYRKHAIWLGPTSIFMAFLIILTFNQETNWLLVNLNRQKVWFALSIIAFAIGYSALWWPGKHVEEETGETKTEKAETGQDVAAQMKTGQMKVGRPRVTVVSVIIQYAIASYAYGSAHLPYVVYPNSTIEASITNTPMLRSLLFSYLIGIVILLPGFIFFWRLFMNDRYVTNK
ncbi:cytochrome d ubiquinol oxidase subunit II [Aneurinibacillus terranovensis]|uniref:cytochrome d ubiquinol oxidase subunit II n=1 Tax=Aneurinibacillus terranovensis TaxID=278991 RepID=UPI000412378F|nr:cytochrome d ubiquinol oxidase subunit II [Aneurinibacillus terranovensis]